jgi:vacuolar-type H+-ATPase subunit H
MPALAQTTPAPENSGAAQSDARHHAMQRMLPGQLVDGRIAFLKAELKITPAQETQWQQVAAAMRENANSLDQAIKTARQDRGSMDAVQRLGLREQFAKVRAENDTRLLAAFKPLYASLSPEQQQVANQLVAPHHERHHRA